MDPRKLVAYGVVTLIAGLLVGKAAYEVWAYNPVGREKASACGALEPTAFNPALGRLPVAAPDFDAQNWSGQMTKLSAYRGQVVFLNFWADWCPPCIDEMPSMDAISKRFVKDPLVVLAVGSGTTWPSMTKKLKDMGLGDTRMTVLLDASSDQGDAGSIPKSWGTEKFPETFLIDKEGKVRYYFVNKRDWRSDKAMQCLRSLIEE